ncbi:response regulator [Deinococcus taklimakanensis]|uniref:Response regulator n=1 Tax=Deinococcus taklimakanensis TaxID=536443 RepID=A0ABW5P0P9_9DEIO
MQPPPPLPPTPDAPPGAELRLLVVDDERQILELLELTLSMQGFDVTTALSGQEALEASRGRSFDALVMDVLMAPWDGFETVRQMRAQSGVPMPPVVFLSGLDRSADMPDLGADVRWSYLVKPFRPSQLVNALLDLVRQT